MLLQLAVGVIVAYGGSRGNAPVDRRLHQSNRRVHATDDLEYPAGETNSVAQLFAE